MKLCAAEQTTALALAASENARLHGQQLSSCSKDELSMLCATLEEAQRKVFAENARRCSLCQGLHTMPCIVALSGQQ